MFQHTGSLGIRRQHSARRKLVRDIFRVSTPLGDARVKLAHQPNGDVRIAPEYEDCRALALAHGISLESAFQIAKDAAEQHFSRLSKDESSHDHSHDHTHDHTHDHSHDHTHDHTHDHGHKH